MSKWSVIFLYILLITANLPAHAEWATRPEARAVAERWLAQRIAPDGEWPESARIESCEELVRQGRLLGYWLPVSPRGHIIVSPLKELPAIKAFSAVTDFDPDQGGYPDLIQDVMEATLAFMAESYGSLESLPAEVAPPANRLSWQRLLEGAPMTRDVVTVGPLLESDWHQSNPFWGDCPMGDGGQCVVGCVATAAAQIINHWRYPDYGEGSHSYYWGGDDSCGDSTPGEQLTAYYDDAYDWANILESYSSGYTAQQASAVAELNYEVAVAFNMDFGHCASGAALNHAEEALHGQFRYATGIESHSRSAYDTEEWWSALCAELDAFPPRPMLYGIFSHAIVCDGYMEDGGHYYHMNYGWGPGSSSWYALDNLYCPWAGCDYTLESFLGPIEPEGYFAVTAPEGGAIWTHGDPIGAVSWWGCDANNVVIDLYRGQDFVARLVDWTANDGSETPLGNVDPTWGAGAFFRVKVIGDDMELAYSDYFGIYGAGAWSDASDFPVNDPNQGRGAAWGDCDGDGLPDLYLSNFTDGNCLFVNEGTGQFSDQTSAPLDDDGFCSAVAWADMDNDGDLDLFLSRSGGQADRLFRNDGSEGFVDIASGNMAAPSSSCGIAWGDYDNDGLIDLYVAHNYQSDHLYHNEGAGVFTDATAAPLGDSGWGRAAAWGDYDDDGDLDLYLVKYSWNELYRNEGDGSFTDLSYPSGLADNGNGFACAWGDYDNDGDLDLYLANDGPNRLFRNDGGGSFSDVTAGPESASGPTHCVAWGDYDNDGYLDLYIAGGGGNQLLHNEMGAYFIDATDPLLGDLSNSEGAAWADYDGDGDLDLYVVNDGAPNRMFQNDNSNGFHWLHVDLAGSASNAKGVGARLRLFAGETTLTRYAGMDAAHYSQGSLTVEFGLGDAQQADSLEVLWPSGQLSRHYDLAADARYELSETGTAVPGDADEATAFALRASYPNPFNPRTEIAFSLPEATPVRLCIFDASGRRVRTLLGGERRFEAGTHHVTWNGLDDASRPLAAGLYLCRLEAGSRMDTHKVTLLK